MNKLFLRDGKLWAGEFPEITELIERDTEKASSLEARHKAAVSAAKARAVEVVNPICGAQYEFMEEGQLYDTPEGWTVEIGYQFETVCGPMGKEWNDFSEPQEENYNFHKSQGRIVRKIARLIPVSAENAQPSGIAAIGVPEYGKGWEGEKFSLLISQETIASDRTEEGIRRAGRKPEDRWGLAGELANIMDDLVMGKLDHSEAKRAILTLFYSKVLSVSPPPQESVINLEALKRICYHFAGIVAPGWQPNAGSAFDPDDSKEVVKVEDLTKNLKN